MKEERREREEQASERRERSACLKQTPETRPTDLTENITPHERKRHNSFCTVTGATTKRMQDARSQSSGSGGTAGPAVSTAADAGSWFVRQADEGQLATGLLKQEH
jgi:hypothetical protein